MFQHVVKSWSKLIVGNELLIVASVAAEVGRWFMAHRHGKLQDLVDAKRDGVDDRMQQMKTENANFVSGTVGGCS